VYHHCPGTTGITWKLALETKKGHKTIEQALQGIYAHRTILAHSNLGLTFDLEALRRDFPGTEILSFRSRIALSGYVVDEISLPNGTSTPPQADFYILLDGVECLRKKGVMAKSGMIDIDVPIDSQARFLTLITTDGDDGSIDHDYCVFVQPELLLEPQ
ncbi:MAG: NPCBM/NEW2 domain-containing protein, partial [Bacteroidales bacterium]|nr:NPCBM/NEW2 domain-containing protein [Bacteroidales bacterium]